MYVIGERGEEESEKPEESEEEGEQEGDELREEDLVASETQSVSTQRE